MITSGFEFETLVPARLELRHLRTSTSWPASTGCATTWVSTPWRSAPRIGVAMEGGKLALG